MKHLWDPCLWELTLPSVPAKDLVCSVDWKLLLGGACGWVFVPSQGLGCSHLTEGLSRTERARSLTSVSTPASCFSLGPTDDDEEEMEEDPVTNGS